MKRLIRNSQKMIKGMPSAVVLSILIHAGLFLLAGMLVVFTVVKKEEKKFVPPKAVERPKMKLRKPKVTVKQNAKPKSTTRIVTKINRASMPDIQLPEISGMADGLSGGLGGFGIMPDLLEATVFGSGQSIGNDFVGTFYDFKRDRNGRVLSVDTTGDEWRSVIYKFLKRGWDTSIFSRYFRSPRKLYATNLVAPLMYSSYAPLAFGDEDAVGALWMVHYKGQLVHKEGITFRFWGCADEFMAVRVDGELCLALGWGAPDAILELKVIGSLWTSDSADSRKYRMGNNWTVVGDWITLEAGVPLDMEILIGDNGGAAAFYLAIEEEGVEYDQNKQGGPILPAFKTADLPRDLLDLIYKELPDGEISLTNGPLFCDYDIPPKTRVANEPEVAVFPAPVAWAAFAEHEIRKWTFVDGRTVEAEFVMIIGNKAALKNAEGKIEKVPLVQLSGEDKTYLELACPPTFNVNFSKNFKKKRFYGGFYDVISWDRPPEDWGHYGVSFKQISTGEYNHDLLVEMFVIGKQFSRNDAKYILLDHQTTTFNPAREEQRFYKFRSKRKVELTDFVDWFGTPHGEKYAGYLITVTDERGEVIVVESSNNWLSENLGNLKKLSVGNYMDKSCTRTFPARPPIALY